MPFANVDTPAVERQVNDNEAIVDGFTLLEWLRMTEFYLLVSESRKELPKKWAEENLPPPSNYPYGSEYGWDLPRYKALLPTIRSKEQYRAYYRYAIILSAPDIARLTEYLIQLRRRQHTCGSLYTGCSPRRLLAPGGCRIDQGAYGPGVLRRARQ
jgi:hypothetical protein